MFESSNIFLIGPMGSGKTSIGKLLAKRLNFDFYDTDSLIEESCGADISWIFELEGEEGFRKREAKILQEFTQVKKIVLSTGGGIILKPENREIIAQNSWCVFLDLSLEEQWRRLHKVKDRPLIQGKDARKKLEELNTFRLPIYRQMADFIVQSTRDRQSEIVESIHKEYLKYTGQTK